MALSIGFKTDKGRVRESNQDSYAVLRRSELYEELDALLVVADGMGGMGGGQGGEVASGIVAQTVPEAIHEKLVERNSNAKPVNPSRLLRETIIRANGNVWMRQVEQPQLRGMGTTCVAAIVQDGMLTIGNVGDSRGYLLREGKLSQITEDHSEVWQEVMAGAMTREEARRSKFRNRITKYIGGRTDIDPDIDTLELQEGDTILLCSDGLTTEVTDNEIARILASIPEAQETCSRLVEAALRKGGSDNITVVVLRYGQFTPFLSAPPVLEDEPDEEETTDEQQEWRKAASYTLSPSASASYTDRDDEPNYRGASRVPYDEEDYEEDDEREETSSGGMSNLAVTLIVLLLILTIAEGIGLFVALKNRTVTLAAVQVGVPQPIQVPSTGATDDPNNRPTAKELTYGTPTILYDKQPLRERPLLVDEFDNAIVVTKSGKVVRIDSKGEAQQLLGMNLGASEVKSGPPYWTMDASQNIYQANTELKTIEKFDLKGTRKVANIGKDALVAPTSIAIAFGGAIYVIDNHKLKKIPATPPKEKPAPGADQSLSDE